MIANSLWLVPQIVFNAYHGRKAPFYPYYFACVLFPQIYAYYVLGCSHNIYMLQPSYWKCLLVTVIIAAQIVILWLQDKEGGGFLLPNFMRLTFHEYYIQININQ